MESTGFLRKRSIFTSPTHPRASSVLWIFVFCHRIPFHLAGGAQDIGDYYDALEQVKGKSKPGTPFRPEARIAGSAAQHVPEACYTSRKGPRRDSQESPPGGPSEANRRPLPA